MRSFVFNPVHAGVSRCGKSERVLYHSHGLCFTVVDLNRQSTADRVRENDHALTEASKRTRGSLLGAILVQKSENVIGPDIGAKVAKRVAVSRRVPIGGKNLQFVGLAHLTHLYGKCLAW